VSDDASTAKLAALRTQKASLQVEVRKLESQVALLEKQGASQKLEEAEAKFEAVNEELQRVTEELDAAEEARQQHAEATDELERLVDSFAPVAAQLPELAEILAAMRLCVGALATARRLERRDESLTEAKDISKALSEALLRLASTMSSRAQVLQVTGRK
jgi:cob(I)alamin adenosyltransferase